MDEIFLTILNMSLVSAMLVAALLLLRPILKKAPKAFMCALWGLVGIRLVCPFTVESVLSLIPTANPVRKEVLLSQIEPMVYESKMSTETIITNTIASSGAKITPLQAMVFVSAFLWAVVVAIMLVVSLVSFLRLKKTVSASLNTGYGVFVNDSIPSPFVLGIFKPRIYLPSNITEDEKAYVIAHEVAHIKRGDHLIKPLGYIILSLHWFNPLVWVAYILLCRDIESACDERVISKMSDEDKKAYSSVLLRLSLPSKKIRACPLAFGEAGVKQRIKSVATYKKPALWICAVAAVIAVTLCVGFMTNPVVEAKTEKESETMTVEECISEAIVEFNKSADADERFAVENFVEIKRVGFEHDVTSYIWAYYGEYELNGNEVVKAFESYKPACVLLTESADGYVVKEYETSSDYSDSDWIYETFPAEIHKSVSCTPGYYNNQKAFAMEIAQMHFGVAVNVDAFYSTFNAQVTEVSENYIEVAPLHGETVGNNSFGKLMLGKNQASTTDYQPDIGDMVRVRFADGLVIDEGIPVLSGDYDIELINKDVSYPYIVYSGGDGNYYIKEPVSDEVSVYKSGTADMWLPGTYFSLNDSMKTFMLMYETVDTSSSAENALSESASADKELEEVAKVVVITGNYEDTNEELRLCIDNSFDRIVYCFDKKGDVFEFNADKTLQECQTPPAYLPFKDGDRFLSALSI